MHIDWILILRWIIFITFLLLLVEGIAAILFARWFIARYERKHLELEGRMGIMEQRMRPKV